ncbi:hypothetical protein K7X08_023677 [Anisodus acutangulus]|uniref:dCTP pyrophosphatase 1 n=1 Tax=Anisodus acutangulus TaxID=402998 RepID=A0A9Q1LAI4_9SOLA|nr:hypothetical protein K7X08_023677 [Anisodus acutangulus]
MKGQAENEGEGSKGVNLEELKNKMADFAEERDWDQFHTPRNLLLALVGEVGELSEIFQRERRAPKRLSDICGIDLGKAALRKLELNAIKYPASLCKGSSKKLALLNKSTTTTSTNSNFYISSDNENGATDGGE